MIAELQKASCSPCLFIYNIKINAAAVPLLADPTFTPQIYLSFYSNHLCPPQPDPLLWAMCSFWEWLLLADVRWVEAEEEVVLLLLAGVSESLSRLLEPLLIHAKQEWQQDSAIEVSPFTAVSCLRWGQRSWKRSTNNAGTHAPMK